MPHPERAIENFYNGKDGTKFFDNLGFTLIKMITKKY